MDFDKLLDIADQLCDIIADQDVEITKLRTEIKELKETNRLLVAANNKRLRDQEDYDPRIWEDEY